MFIKETQLYKKEIREITRELAKLPEDKRGRTFCPKIQQVENHKKIYIFDALFKIYPKKLATTGRKHI